MPSKGVPSKGPALPIETYQRANPPSHTPAPPLRLAQVPPIAPEAQPPPARRVVGRIGLTQQELAHFRTELEPVLNLERVRRDYVRRGLEI